MNWQNIHKTQLSILLKAIYKKNIPNLVFKGGTSMLFFLGLGRFSVDLDFDFIVDSDTKMDIDTQKKDLFKIIEKIIIDNKLQIKKSYIKRNTIFFLVSYSNNSKNIKIEISTRGAIKAKYKLYNFYGTIIPVMDWKTQLAFKIIALGTRKQPRDLFDILHYVKKQIYPVPEEVEFIYKNLFGKTKRYKDILQNAKNTIINDFDSKNMMVGLGELLYDDKQKAYIKSEFLNESLLLIDSLDNL